MKICACEIKKRHRENCSYIQNFMNDLAARGLLVTDMENLGHWMDGKPVGTERIWNRKS